MVAFVLFYRYLKFFKHYTEEVFRDYAEPEKPPLAAAPDSSPAAQTLSSPPQPAADGHETVTPAS